MRSEPFISFAESSDQHKVDGRHSCDKEIRADPNAMSGHRETGDRWKCSCGQIYQHEWNEAEGCSWVPVKPRKRRKAVTV
jgi:hypothetical protein